MCSHTHMHTSPFLWPACLTHAHTQSHAHWAWTTIVNPLCVAHPPSATNPCPFHTKLPIGKTHNFYTTALTGHCWNYCLFEVLSAGAFTGRFNYLQLAKGLALSQPLFVCSLQGVCAERNMAAMFYEGRKGREKKKFGEPLTGLRAAANSGPPCPLYQKPVLLNLPSLQQVLAPWVPLLEFAWGISACLFFCFKYYCEYIFKLPIRDSRAVKACSPHC